jgi:PIN domain nuclease of toxin-antitoxin system
MRILLDTSEFLWFISGDKRLSPATAAEIRIPANSIFLSVVSFWEICLKNNLGELPLPAPPAQYIPEQREKHSIESLVLTESAIRHLADLPQIHRDPFDRILICQALAEGLTIASSDSLIRQYPVTML